VSSRRDFCHGRSEHFAVAQPNVDAVRAALSANRDGRRTLFSSASIAQATSLRSRREAQRGAWLRNTSRRRPRWRIVLGPGDFLPLVIGCVLLFISLPGFTVLLLVKDRNWGVLGPPVIVILGLGTLLGLGFLVLGLQHCTRPGSFWYRLVHGRFFSR
jgi:hypothetical protein